MRVDAQNLAKRFKSAHEDHPHSSTGRMLPPNHIEGQDMNRPRTRDSGEEETWVRIPDVDQMKTLSCWKRVLCWIGHDWRSLAEGSPFYPFNRICANPTGIGEGQDPETLTNTVFNFAEYRKCMRCGKKEDFRCALCVACGTGTCFRRMFRKGKP